MPIIAQIILGILILAGVYGVWVWLTMRAENKLNRRLSGEERWLQLYPHFAALPIHEQQRTIKLIQEYWAEIAQTVASSSTSALPPDNASGASGRTQKKTQPLSISDKQDVKVWNCQKSES